MNVLLSIKPIYVNEILAGKKKFEFRKAIFKKKDISKVFIYSSSPVQKIVASFEIARIIENSPQKIWEKCWKYAGIPKEDFFEYFKNSDVGYAIEIKNLEKLSEPIDPYLLEKDFKPPQSYCYLPLDHFDNKSQSNSAGKEYKNVFLAEEKEEYSSKESAVEEKMYRPNQRLEVLERGNEWANVTLNDIAKWGSGGTPKSTNPTYYGGNIPWLIIGDLSDGYVWKSEKKITEEGLKNSSAKMVAPESVLIAMYGSIGKLGINKVPVATNQAIAFTEKLYAPTNNKYLFYYLLFSRPTLYKMGKGGTQRNISQTVLKTVDFPLPPFPEQRAIVSKIEQLFSDLDNGISNLKLAQGQLKVYRQAVLKKAFEGELTRKWREQQVDLPSAEELLEEIKREREGVAKTSGKKVKPVNPLNEGEIMELSRLPEGWGWVKIGEVLEVFVGSTPSRKETNYWGGEIPWVSSGEVAFCKINSTKECITKLGLDNSSTQVHPVGTVMLGMIGEGKTRGQVAILNINACHNQNTAAIRTGTCYLSEFIYYVFVKNYVETRRIGSGNNQQALNKSIIENIPIPLCSLPEQRAIVQEIETRLSVCDKLEQDIAENLEKAEALRQSILKRAFEGKLLNQRELEEVRRAPDWEPAEVLLERVRAERERNGKI